ncbi:MAG: uroporphyrinogen-III synthase, partial [Actinomycetota bacterium]|nr:uroporphyrinogen-III synthase [Actinomycetota bacterium]
AAVGPASARALREAGAPEVVLPQAGHTASALLAALRPFGPATAVLPRSSVGDELLPRTLEARGWSVLAEVVYDTTPVDVRPEAAGRLARGVFDALVLRSPSAARAVARHAGPIPASTKVIAGGPTTALAARRLGIAVAAMAPDSRAASIAASVIEALDGRDRP